MKEIKKVAIVGAGIMGAGIANAIFRQNKYDVNIYDVDHNLLENAYNLILKGARKSMDPGKIQMATSLEDLVKDADLIIEAIVENIDVKCELFSKLNEISSNHTIFASNTSSLNITEMAKASKRPDRFLGFHFFNPPVVMRLVEIIVPNGIDSSVLQAVEVFVNNIKKVGIKCKESPAFVVNRILIPIINEAFYLLEESGQDDVIDAANRIDSAMVKENVLPMGPYELVDLTGIDTANIVAGVIYRGFDNNPRYQPAPLMKKYVEKGLLGRKNGAGIYRYANTINDPDANPCLNQNNDQIVRLNESEFSTLNLTAVMVNEAFRVLEDGIVDDFQDIETCMELGTRWVKGPFALAKEIGLTKIISFLNKKFATGVARYEPSKMLVDLPPQLASFFND